MLDINEQMHPYQRFLILLLMLRNQLMYLSFYCEFVLFDDSFFFRFFDGRTWCVPTSLYLEL